MSKLSDKQRLFCQNYVKHFNALKAYRESYPTCKTDNAAAAASTRLMKKPEIQDYIKELKEENTRDFKQDLQEILEDLHNTAKGDYTDAYEMQGDAVVLKNLKDMPKHIRKMITRIKTVVNEDGSGMLIDVNFDSKERAREQVFKYHGVYAPEKREHKIRTIDEIINSGEIYEDKE